jgi:SPP1 gp7 family putative phage head morphogenesis protein
MDYNEDDLFKGVYNGNINTRALPVALYQNIATKLEKAIYKGYGANIMEVEFGGVDYALLSELRENIYMFSGAKTFGLVDELQKVSALLSKGDKVPNFKEFREQAQQIFNTDKKYLETEYTTAIGQAQSAKQWIDIQKGKKLFPYLTYDAVLDSHTSDICKPLEGITLPVDHPFWNTHSPLNHWRCRCRFIQVDKYEDVNITPPDKVQDAAKDIDPKMQDVFKMNPGKDKVIFNKDHPYFDVAPKDKNFAKENFGMPIPPVKK